MRNKYNINDFVYYSTFDRYGCGNIHEIDIKCSSYGRYYIRYGINNVQIPEDCIYEDRKDVIDYINKMLDNPESD